MLTEHADPSGFKDPDSARSCEGCFRMGRMCLSERVWGGGDGVKPKALSPQLYNAGMTGGHDREFQGSGLGIPLSEYL